jgi:hypothetical protein
MTARSRLNRGLVVLTLLWAVAPAAQAGTTVATFRSKGDTLTANFSTVDRDNSCLLSFVSLTSADLIEKIRPDGRIETVRTMLTLIRVDTCRGDLLFSGAGTTSASVVTVAANLSSAELTATVSMLDDRSGATSDFQVNLTWEATTKAVTSNFTDSFKDKDLGIKVKGHFQGTMREAVATGTVFGLGQNLTPEPSDSASIQRQNFGTQEITKTF